MRASALGDVYADSLVRWEQEITQLPYDDAAAQLQSAHFSVWCELMDKHHDPEAWMASINDSRIVPKPAA